MLDKYQLFCLKQVLKELNLSSVINKVDTNKYDLYLTFYSKDAGKILLNKLQEYDIYGIIKQIKRPLQ